MYSIKNKFQKESIQQKFSDPRHFNIMRGKGGIQKYIDQIRLSET